MSNLKIIAIKEFKDLINSRIVMLILLWYITIVILSINNTFGQVDPNMDNLDKINNLFIGLVFSLTYYGSLVAIVLGFSSMSAEMDSKAINTILVKPLYRDTIINGKLLGNIGMILGLFLLTTIVYLVSIIIILDYSYIYIFINKLPLAFILSILCITFFYHYLC